MNLITILPTFVAALAVGFLIRWLKKQVDAYDPAGSAAITGVIKPHKGIAYFTLGMGMVFFILGCLGAIYMDEFRVFGYLVVLFGAFITLSQIPSLTPIYDVHWNDESFNGPAKSLFQMMMFSRNELMWSDIVKVGLVKGPYHYLEGTTGDRIYWSRSYQNYEDFEATVKDKCPTLVWPKFEIFPK